MTNITDTEARDIDGGMPDHWIGTYVGTASLCLDYYAVLGTRAHVGCIAQDAASQLFGTAMHAL